MRLNENALNLPCVVRLEPFEESRRLLVGHGASARFGALWRVRPQQRVHRGGTVINGWGTGAAAAPLSGRGSFGALCLLFDPGARSPEVVDELVQLLSAVDVQLLVYVVGVGLHGGHGHEQLLGDLGRVLFLGQEQQDVRLALGEGVLHGNGGADLDEGVVVRHRVGYVATGALHPPHEVWCRTRLLRT